VAQDARGLPLRRGPANGTSLVLSGWKIMSMVSGSSFPRAESEVVNPCQAMDSLPVPRSSSEVIKPSEIFLDLMMLEPLKAPISRQATAVPATNGMPPGYVATRPPPARPPALSPIQATSSYGGADGHWTPVGIAAGTATPPNGAGSFVLRRGMEVPRQVMPQLGYASRPSAVVQPPTEAANIIRPHRPTAMSMATGTVPTPGMPFASSLAPSQVRTSPQAVSMSYQGQVATSMPQAMVSGISSWQAPVTAVSASLQLPSRTMPVPQPASMTVPGQPMQRPMQSLGLGTARSSTAPSPGLIANGVAATAQPSLQPQPQWQLPQMMQQQQQPSMRFQQPQVTQSQYGQRLPQQYCQAPHVQMQMPLTPPRQQPLPSQQIPTQQLQPQPQQVPFQMRAVPQGQVVQPQVPHMSPAPQQPQQLPQALSTAWATPTRQPLVQLVQPMGMQPMQSSRLPVPSASAMPSYAQFVGQGGGVAAEAAKRAAMAFPLP